MIPSIQARALLVLALVVLAFRAGPAGASPDAVDAIIRDEMEQQHIAGLALAVVRTGIVVQASGYGLADVEHGVKVVPETVFKIGSVSKQFIATAVMLLEEEGKLALEDKLGAHLEDTPEAWGNITLEHLLTHTAGLVRECPGFNRWEPVSDAEAVRSAYPEPLVFPPGSRHQYSNCGYFALAEVIRRRAGQSWSEFIDARVFTPAGMEHTRTTSATNLIPRRARGYAWRTHRWQNTPDYIAVRPSGAFVSTVLDLARWDAALVRGKVLSKQIQDRMCRPVTLTGGTNHLYGLGWSLDPFQGRRRVHHSGSLPGFRSHYMRLPDDGLTVIVLANEDGARPLRIAERVAEAYLPAP